MTYRAGSPSSASTYESEPMGCGCGLGMSVVFVPMWAIPIGIASEWWDRGFSPIFVVLALVDVALWIGLFFLVTGGARLTLDAEGLRWESYRTIGPIRTPAHLVRSAPWALVSAALVRKLKTHKNGSPYEEVVLQLTMPDGEHDVAHDTFKPWGSLVKELENRLGDRWTTRDDHGALGAAVQRIVDQRLKDADGRPNDVKIQ